MERKMENKIKPIFENHEDYLDAAKRRSEELINKYCPASEKNQEFLKNNKEKFTTIIYGTGFSYRSQDDLNQITYLTIDLNEETKSTYQGNSKSWPKAYSHLVETDKEKINWTLTEKYLKEYTNITTIILEQLPAKIVYNFLNSLKASKNLDLLKNKKLIFSMPLEFLGPVLESEYKKIEHCDFSYDEKSSKTLLIALNDDDSASDKRISIDSENYSQHKNSIIEGLSLHFNKKDKEITKSIDIEESAKADLETWPKNHYYQDRNQIIFEIIFK